MALQDTDLLYVDRGGTSYQVTWLQIRTRSGVLATDELLIQRGSIMYQVPIGDFWTCTETSQPNDFFLVERGGALYHEEILFPCQVQFSVSAGTSTTLFMSAIPDAFGNNPSIVAPDGTVTPLTSTGTSYTFTQNGTYTLSGDFTNFKFTGSDGVVDASLTDGAVWNGVFGNVPNFGEELFSNINELSGLPTGLALSSLDRTFTSTSPSGDMSVIDVSAATSAKGTFLNSDIDPTDDITAWDVSNVTDMGRMFEGASVFNVDISAWDVSNVTNMARMFQGASVFDVDISAWDTGAVTEMQSMLAGAATFNQDLGTWNVAAVSNMNAMFDGASSFNQDIGDWDVEDSVDMTSMFKDANQFDQDLTEWCVRTIPTEPTDFSTGSSLLPVNKPVWGTCPVDANGDVILNSGTLRIRGTIPVAGQIVSPTGLVTNIGPGNWIYTTTTTGRHTLPMNDMEWLAFNQNTSTNFDFDPGFYTGNLTNMFNMFNNARVFNGDISNWDTSRVTNMTNMFRDARDFDRDIGSWTTGSVTGATDMFFNADAFNQDLSGWNTGNISNFSNFFAGADSFNGDISTWNVASATTFYRMFDAAYAFNNDIGSWNVSNATNMFGMLRNTHAFNQDLSAWDTSNVTNMSRLFSASAINSPIFSNTANVENMAYMFEDASNFNQDINSWDVRNVESMIQMFSRATSFNQSLPDWVPNNPAMSRIDMTNMFTGAASMQGDLSNWCIPQVTSIPSNFDTGAAFQGNTAIQPQWGTCPVDGTGLTVTNLNGDKLYVSFEFSNSLTQEIIFPDGSVVPVTIYDNIDLDQIGTYQLPMGVVRKMQFGGSTSSVPGATNAEFTFDPDFYTGGITNMSRMFYNCRAFNGDISNWDTSGVTCMISLFDNNFAFNGDISGWNTSRVGNFFGAFENTLAFDTSISEWDTSSATNMGEMFKNAQAYNQDMSLWDVGNVTNMARMFQNTQAFNQYLNPWDVAAVTNMRNMFNMATAMSGDISNWCVPQFSSKPNGFDRNAAFENDLTLLPDWGTCTSFNGIYLKELVGGTGDFVIGGVAADNTVQIRQPDGTITNPGTGTFANKYTQLGWYEIQNMGSLTGLRFFDNDILFDDTSETAKFYFSSSFDTSNLNEFRQMFREAEQFDGDISMFDTSNATNMAAMFRNNAAFDGDISFFDTENVDNMSNMFRGATSFTGDISGWSVFNVTDMDNMFRNAAAFGVNLSDWCVPGIGSAPNDFDTDSGFEGNTAIQPGWGTCPLAITFSSAPVIVQENGTVPAPYGELLEIGTAANVTPAGATIVGYQWQRSADGSTGWTDVPAGEGNSTSATRQVNGYDRNQYMRLVITYSADMVPDVSIESNAIQVENGNPPTFPLYTENKFTDFPLGQQVYDEATQAYFPVQLLGTDGLLYNYAANSPIIGRIDPNIGVWIDFREVDYTGIVAVSNRNYWMGGTAVPSSNKHIIMGANYRGAMVYDYVADTVETITFDTQPQYQGSRGLVYSSVTDKFYSVPFEPVYNSTYTTNVSSDNIYEIDATALTGTTVFTNRFASEPNVGRVYSGACEGPDGKLYFFPNYVNTFGAPHLGQFDPQTYTMVDMTCPIPLSGLWNGNKYVSFGTPIYSPEANAIYACPYNANSFIKLDFNNMVGGVPTASEVTQTVDPRTEVDGRTRGKWSGMVRREDGLLQCLPVVVQAPNAALDPSTDSVLDLGDNNLGQSANSTFGGAIMCPNGKASSALVMATKNTGGASNKIEQSPFWETFAGAITIYDPMDPAYNKIFGVGNNG